MVKSFKKLLVAVLAFLVILCSAVAVLFGNFTNYARATGEGVAQLVDGASVRYGSKNGLRFTFRMTADKYDEAATYGILIAPNAWTEKYALNEDNVFGESAKYYWETEDGTPNTTTTGKRPLANVITEKFVDTTAVINEEEVDVKEFYASLTDLLDGTYDAEKNPDSLNNINREFKAVGYIRTGEEGSYSYEFIENDTCVRSMAYVAQRAIEFTGEGALSDEVKENLNDLYVEKVTNLQDDYTQEHYFEQADGSYVKNDSLTDVISTKTIDDSVSYAKKTVLGYMYDSANGSGVSSGKVYANGKLVLKGYYKKIEMLKVAPVAKNTSPAGTSMTISDVITTATVTRTDGLTTMGSTDYTSQAKLKRILKLPNYPIAGDCTIEFSLTSPSRWISLWINDTGFGGVNANKTLTVVITVEGGVVSVTANNRTVKSNKVKSEDGKVDVHANFKALNGNFTNLNQITIGPVFQDWNSYGSFTVKFSPITVNGEIINVAPSVQDNNTLSYYSPEITGPTSPNSVSVAYTGTSAWTNTQNVLKLTDYTLADGKSATFTVKNTSSSSWQLRINMGTGLALSANEVATVVITKTGENELTVTYSNVATTRTVTVESNNLKAVIMGSNSGYSFSMTVSAISIYNT